MTPPLRFYTRERGFYKEERAKNLFMRNETCQAVEKGLCFIITKIFSQHDKEKRTMLAIPAAQQAGVNRA